MQIDPSDSPPVVFDIWAGMGAAGTSEPRVYLVTVEIEPIRVDSGVVRSGFVIVEVHAVKEVDFLGRVDTKATMGIVYVYVVCVWI